MLRRADTVARRRRPRRSGDCVHRQTGFTRAARSVGRYVLAGLGWAGAGMYGHYVYTTIAMGKAKERPREPAAPCCTGALPPEFRTEPRLGLPGRTDRSDRSADRRERPSP